MTIRKISNNLTPLCFLPCGKLVCYKRGNLVLLEHDKLISSYPIFFSFKERWLGYCNVLYRLLRVGIRAAIALDDEHIIFSIKNMLYEYSFTKRKLSKGYTLPLGIRPLIFTKVHDIRGFTDGIVFGGYLSNFDKKPVEIYRRKDIDQWEVVYSFEHGTINHVHNIVPDSYRQCLWALTGDFGKAAAIWKITDDFQKVERVLYDNQMYRSCVAFPVKEGLLYATDTPFAPNNIYLLTFSSLHNFPSLVIRPLFSIDGSCIYGCQYGDKYVFASTVEPDGRYNTRLNLLVGRKRGSGIKDMYAHMYIGNMQEGFHEIYKEKKDFWPYLFQFATIRFPYGINKINKLYFQPIATSKNDLRLLYFELSV